MRFAIIFTIAGHANTLYTDSAFTAYIVALTLSKAYTDHSIEVWAGATLKTTYHNGQSTPLNI